VSHYRQPSFSAPHFFLNMGEGIMQQADKSVSTSIKRRDSLRTRLMVLFLLMSVIPMALIGTISYIQSQQMMVNRIKSDLITQTSLKESNISMFLSARKDNMVVLAGTARVRSMDPTQAVDAMDQYFKQWGIYESLSLYDLNGDTIYRRINLRSMSPNVIILKTHWTEKPQFRNRYYRKPVEILFLLFPLR
jgi:hypothetical protein